MQCRLARHWLHSTAQALRAGCSCSSCCRARQGMQAQPPFSPPASPPRTCAAAAPRARSRKRKQAKRGLVMLMPRARISTFLRIAGTLQHLRQSLRQSWLHRRKRVLLPCGTSLVCSCSGAGPHTRMRAAQRARLGARPLACADWHWHWLQPQCWAIWHTAGWGTLRDRAGELDVARPGDRVAPRAMLRPSGARTLLQPLA